MWPTVGYLVHMIATRGGCAGNRFSTSHSLYTTFPSFHREMSPISDLEGKLASNLNNVLMREILHKNTLPPDPKNVCSCPLLLLHIYLNDPDKVQTAINNYKGSESFIKIAGNITRMWSTAFYVFLQHCNNNYPYNIIIFEMP